MNNYDLERMIRMEYEVSSLRSTVKMLVITGCVLYLGFQLEQKKKEKAEKAAAEADAAKAEVSE